MSDFNVKYRPQKIEELDLVSVREGLAQVFQSGKIPQAFLFAGPRGIGKTSAARIVAKLVNCAAAHPPCNKCDQCLSITAGTNLDILEIDAASNRGIDDIRDLREKIKLAPTSAKFKVYIIDEAHMLTIEAFNALLKTLEEPPKHALFILCTTQSEKLPETIISRCLRFNFKRASQAEVVEKLKKIAKEEKIGIELEALAEIAKAVKGSFRDALRVLEQASFSGGKITREQIKEILGQTVGLEPEKLLEFLVVKDIRGALKEIDRVVSSGGNLRVYCEELLEMLRIILLAKVGVTEYEIVATRLPAPDAAGYGGQAEALKIEEIKTLIGLFSKAALELKEAVIPQLPLELAVVEWSSGGGIGESVSPSAGLGGDVKQPLSSSPEGAIPQAPHHTGAGRSSDSSKRSDPPNLTIQQIQSRWQEVLLGVRPRNYSIEALLRATRPVEFTDHVLTLEVFYQFHKDKLESDKCREILEEVMSEVFQTPFSVRCILGQRPRAADETGKSIVPDNSRSISSNGNGETAFDAEPVDEDIVKVAEEIFGTNAD